MPITPIYERILDDLVQGQMEEIEQKVFHALRRVYPQGRTRVELIMDVFGYMPGAEENLNNNHDDRKIRAAIGSLFAKGIPIVSTSSGAGYHIDVDLEKWEEMINELENRRNSLNERIEAAQRIQRKIHAIELEAIPTDLPARPKQLTLIPEER